MISHILAQSITLASDDVLNCDLFATFITSMTMTPPSHSMLLQLAYAISSPHVLFMMRRCALLTSYIACWWASWLCCALRWHDVRNRWMDDGNIVVWFVIDNRELMTLTPLTRANKVNLRQALFDRNVLQQWVNGTTRCRSEWRWC